MADVKRRLDAVEDRLKQGGQGEFLAVYLDPDDPGVFWQHAPWATDRGRRYTQAELDELDPEDLLIIEYVKDWRSVG